MKAIYFYNTLSRQKERFQPLDKNLKTSPAKQTKEAEVKIYSCGPTVYGSPHIGNYRSFLFSDLLHRFLLLMGYKVQLVMNITDIDDKTIHNANAEKLPLQEYTQRYTKIFMKDIQALGMLPAAAYPKASEHIEAMVKMIQTLLEKKHAYQEAGSIYFRLNSFSEYGKLSGIDIEGQQAGASQRLSADEYERDNISDFSLWKNYKSEDGPVFFNTPLGKGRPGWHIECSAMAKQYLGEELDIHTGGVDNRFPHHENELAQSTCANGKALSKLWMHAAHLLVEGEKMSKSLGNVYTLEDLRQKGASLKAIRYMLLSSHYRSVYNFSFSSIEGCQKAITRITLLMEELRELAGSKEELRELAGSKEELRELAGSKNPASEDLTSQLMKIINTKADEFIEALCDDLNVSAALAKIFETAAALKPALQKKEVSASTASRALDFFRQADTIFAVFSDSNKPLPEETIEDENILKIVAEREQERKNKNYITADVLRQKIEILGYQIKDTPEGTSLKKRVRLSEPHTKHVSTELQ